MKILHLADTHLGFSAYRKITTEGINQREIDIYTSFQHCIDYALQTKPDLILHAGDLFDSVRPSNRAISEAMHQLLRLEAAQIPTIIISGNHETPRLKETGNIFQIFDHLQYITLIYHNHYEKHHLTLNNQKLTIHALPQTSSKQEFEQQLTQVKPDQSADLNILMAHGAVAHIKEFRMNEFNELMIPINTFASQFDYIALGHYHKYTKIAENIYYAGSPDRFSFTEATDPKGLLELTIKKQLNIKFIPLNIRPMHDFPPIDCTNSSIQNITHHIQQHLHSIDPTNAIIRITLHNLSPELYHALDFHQLRQLGTKSLHFEIRTTLHQSPPTLSTPQHHLFSLTQEFQHYVEQQPIPHKKQLIQLGTEYLTKIENTEVPP